MKSVKIGAAEASNVARLCSVARLARVIAVDVPHRVTHRGNTRQFILASDADRRVYPDQLREAKQT